MQRKALIVLPESAAPGLLADYLSAQSELVPVLFSDEDRAVEWLKANPQPVDLAFLSRHHGPLLEWLQSQPQAPTAAIYLIAGAQEENWIHAIMALNDQVDDILVKPFRPLVLVETIERILRTPKSTSALLLDTTGELGTIQESLNYCGFQQVYQCRSEDEAMTLLQNKKSEIRLLISHWEMPTQDGIQILGRLKKDPRFFNLPTLLITSQHSLEEIKSLQMAQFAVAALLPPLSPDLLKVHINLVLDAVRSDRKGAETARMLETQKVLKGLGPAIDLLKEAMRESSSPLLYRLLGTWLEERAAYGSAAEAYQAACRLQPWHKPTLIKAMGVFRSLGKAEQGVGLAKAYLRRMGFDDEVRTQLGKDYLICGDRSAACVEFRRALKINPMNSEAQSLLQVTSSLEASPHAGASGGAKKAA